jgi:hypothetical protein
MAVGAWYGADPVIGFIRPMIKGKIECHHGSKKNHDLAREQLLLG